MSKRPLFRNAYNTATQNLPNPMNSVKSKQRVADHGEVFTPAWMVEAMLDLVKDETERIDARFLEPACGSGNFLVQILRRKLAAVELRYGKSDFERRQYALLALMCIYGIELLADNIAECRANTLEILADYLQLDEADDLYRAAYFVLSQNLLHGNFAFNSPLSVRCLTNNFLCVFFFASLRPCAVAPLRYIPLLLCVFLCVVLCVSALHSPPPCLF